MFFRNTMYQFFVNCFLKITSQKRQNFDTYFKIKLELCHNSLD